MKPHSIQGAIFLACLLTANSIPAAEGPGPAIPDVQDPVRRVIKPQPNEWAPPGTEKCVIFTREKMGGENEWDFVAGAWEFVPSRPEAGVVKRVEFVRSSWTARLAVEDELKIDGPARDLVRLQVDDSGRKPAYRSHLYRINFRTWDVEFLKGEFVGVLGGNPDTLLVYNKTGVFPFDVKTGEVLHAAEPFVILNEDHEAGLWLIASEEDGKESVWSYRPATLEKIAQIPWPQQLSQRELPEVRSAARPDGKAWSLVTLDKTPDRTANARKNPFGEAEQGDGSLWLAEAGGREPSRWPVRFQVAEGSGVGWRSFGTELWFEDGALCFQAKLKDPKGNDVIRQWTVGKDGKGISESVATKPHEPRAMSRRGVIRIPEKYRSENVGEFASEKYQLAAAFLRWKGLVKKLPQYADCRVGFTADMRRFVWKTLPSYSTSRTGKDALPSRNVLLYGDLDKETVLEIPCPPELRDDNALEIEWVVTR